MDHLVVIDTNVAIVANDAAKPADAKDLRSPDCIEACVEAILKVTSAGHLVLDRGGLIFDEYKRYLRFEGQPGVGDVFLKWIHDRQWDEAVCTQVEITRHPGRGFVEFPDNPELQGFDDADRMFVAVAVAHPDQPSVLQAVDYGWETWAAVLEEEGVHVTFLCPRR